MALDSQTTSPQLSADRTQPSEFHGVLIDGTGSSYGEAPLAIRGVRHVVDGRVEWQNFEIVEGSRDAAYETSVLVLLNRIYGTQVGRALFREIEGPGRSTVTIRPAEKEGRGKLLPTSEKKATASTSRVDIFELCTLPRKRMPNERPCSQSEQVRPPGWTPGHIVTRPGNYDAEIRFTPRMFADLLATSKRLHPGAEPDEILVHEMVHAVRIIMNLASGSASQLDYKYENEDEFYAFLIANIYASETFRIMKCNYLTPDVCALTDEEFLTETSSDKKTALHFRLVRQLVSQMPVLTNALRLIHCSFNPIRRYYEIMAKKGGGTAKQGVPIS